MKDSELSATSFGVLNDGITNTNLVALVTGETSRNDWLLGHFGVNTLIVGEADQDQTLQQITESVGRYTRAGSLKLVGIVEPTEENVDALATAHEERSIFVADAAEARESLGEEGAVVMIFARYLTQHILKDSPDGYSSALQRSKQWRTIAPTVFTQNNKPQSGGQGSRSSEAARVKVSMDYNGNLGGGSPKNALRVGKPNATRR